MPNKMELKRKVLKGITWSGFSQAGKLISQFVVTVILARLLSPSDFGLIGMANIFIYLIKLMNEMGPLTAIIQNQKTNNIHYSTIFWFNAGFGISFFFLFSFTAPLIADFFGEESLTGVLRLLSFVLIILSLSIVQKALLTKTMDFRKIAMVDNISILIGGIIGIVAALRGYGVYSLVYQVLSQSVCEAVLFWSFSKWRPGFIFSMRAFRELYSFMFHVTGHSILNYVSQSVDYFLIGKFLGAEMLGYYTLAFKLMMVPVRNVAWVISQVLFPAFSSIQKNIGKVRTHYLIMLKGVSYLTFPMMCGLFILAPEFVYVVVGEKWETSILIIRVFCFSGILLSISTTYGSIMLSQGRPDLQFWLGIWSTLLIVIFVSIGLRWGINGVAVSYVLQGIIWEPYVGYRALKLINLAFPEFCLMVFNCFLYNIPMIIGVLLLKTVFDLNHLHSLILFSIMGMVIYFLTLWVKEKRFLLDNLQVWRNKQY